MQTGRKQKRVGPKAVYSVLESLHISLHSARCKIMQLLRNTTKLTWPISRDFWNQTTLVTWKIRSPKSFQLLWSQFPGHRSGCASSSCRNLSAWRSGSWTNKRLARLSPLVKSSYVDPLITLNLCMLIVHLLFSWLQRAQHFPQLSIFFHYEKNNIYYIYIRVCIVYHVLPMQSSWIAPPLRGVFHATLSLHLVRQWWPSRRQATRCTKSAQKR